MDLRPSRPPVRSSRVSRALGSVAAVLVASFVVPAAQAVPVVVLDSGTLYTDRSISLSGLSVELFGPSLVFLSPHDRGGIRFGNSEDPAQASYRPGAPLELDAVGGGYARYGHFRFRGELYLGTASIQLDTASFQVEPLVSAPFTLLGAIHGCIPLIPPEGFETCENLGDIAAVDVSVVGSGTLRATFGEGPEGQGLRLEQLWYEVEPVPEPTTLLLLAGGLALAGARGRRAAKPRLR